MPTLAREYEYEHEHEYEAERRSIRRYAPKLTNV
jgi:hypothetical protein